MNKTGNVQYLSALGPLSMTEFNDTANSENNEQTEELLQPNTVLSDLLLEHFSNPFHRYARFSAKVSHQGTASVAAHKSVRTMKISLYFSSRSSVGSEPMTVYVNVENARIVDFIGLILWQYVEENRVPQLPYAFPA